MPTGKNSESPQSARGGTQSQEGFPTEAAQTNIEATDDVQNDRAFDRPLSDSASPHQGVDGPTLN